MRAPLLLVLLTVGACGGGGGGDPAPSVTQPAPTPTPPAPAPLNPLALTDGNAVPATALVMREIEHVHVAAANMIFTADVLTFRNTSAFSVSCADGVVTELRAADNDRSGTVSTGDVLSLSHVSCHGVARNTSMLVSSADFATGRLEGRVDFVFATDAGVRSVGAFWLSSTFNVAAHELTQEMTEIDVSITEGATTAVVNAARSERFVARSDQYRVSFSGAASSSALGGRFDFATSTPFSGRFGAVPELGQLDLSGGTSRARIAPSNDDRFDYEVDGGSGAFGAPRSAAWRAVVTGLIFCWDANTRPEITSLALTPAQPTKRDQLTATYAAVDADGDALTYIYDWFVNGTPQAIPALTLPLTRFKKGDVVQFVLRVSDSRITTVQTASLTLANTPPENVTVRFEPPVARTTDDLTLFSDAIDIDGDPSQLTYEWRRNGLPIAGHTAQFLSHALHAKDDVITGIVHVNDGEAVTTASASITIADTPPVVAVPDTIDGVDYGDVLTFDMSAEDVDGDPTGQFQLVYGPAGMSVDPMTGRVTWPMRGPAFERDVEMRFGITLDQPGATVATGSVGLHAPAREQPLYRTGFEAPLSSALKAGDFDGDGDEELLVVGADAVYELEWTGTTYRQSWTYPFLLNHGDRPAALATADVDGDGRHEIFVAYGAAIIKLDGIERRYETNSGFGFPSSVFRDLEIADVDRDGILDLLAVASHNRSGDPAASGLVMRFRADLMSYITSYGANEGSSIAVGNVDGDAALEVVVNSGYVFDGVTWLNEWRYMPAFGWEVATGDLDGDGIDEIVASVADGAVRAYNAVTRSPTWTVANLSTDAVVVADVVGDGDAEVLIGDGNGGGLVKVYAQTAPNAATLLAGVTALGDDVPALATGDVDGDGEIELIWGSTTPGSALAVAGGSPLAVEWTTEDLDHRVLGGPYVGGALARRPGNAPNLVFAAVQPVNGGVRVLGLDP
jgi:hypothetical protein